MVERHVCRRNGLPLLHFSTALVRCVWGRSVQPVLDRRFSLRCLRSRMAELSLCSTLRWRPAI